MNTEIPDLSALPDPKPATPDDELVPIAAPCTIHMKDGGTVTVTKIAAWEYTPQGIFAQGHWNKRNGEVTVLVPYDQVRIIELDFEALKDYLQEADAPTA